VEDNFKPDITIHIIKLFQYYKNFN